MGSMRRRSAQAILIGVVIVWAIGLWVLNVGAREIFNSPQHSQTPCTATVGPVSLPPGCGGSASPSPSPSPTRGTASPTGGQTQSPRESPTQTGSPSPTRSPSPTASPSPTQSPTPTVQQQPSKISIAYRRRAFNGRVRSSNRCEPRRRVVLKRVKRGRDQNVAQDLTNRTGRWKIRMPNPRRGRYYATVNVKTVTGPGNSRTRCRRARSRKIRP
jgi:hypothetical protein